MKRLAEDFRRMGYPVRSIQLRDNWMWREPDEYHDEGEVFWGGRSKNRKTGLTAPTFDWELEDGRRFFGKTRVHAKRVERSVLFVTEIRYRVDQMAQLKDLQDMILESIGPSTAPPKRDV
jgi:hypothetical protein